MVDNVLDPSEVGVAGRRHTKPPALVSVEGVAMRDLALNPANGEVHFGEPPGGIVRLLTVNGYVGPGCATIAVSVCVRPDELDRLHEHTGGAAAGIIDSPFIRLDHLH